MTEPKDSADKAEKKEDGENLTTILDKSQRADLTLLIANITEAMRQLILENFDAKAGLDKSLFQDRSKMTDEEKMMASDPSTADVDAFEKQHKLKEEYEKDINTLKMKNLKKNSLKAFDDWREQVLLRVGEVVNSRETAKKQLTGMSRGDGDGGKKEGGAGTASPNPEAPATSIGKIIETPNRGSKLRFKDLYPPTKSPLTKLTMDKRTLLLHSVLLLLLSLEHYSAPSRVLLLLLTSSLKLPLKTFEQDEYATAKGLLEGAKELTAELETKKKVEENKESRKWKVGLATAAGAAIIGVTGGLAAPLVASGVGSIMGGLGLGATSAAAYLGSVAGSTYLVGGLFGAYGGRMTGQMMDNYAREVEDFEFLPVHSNQKTSEDEEQGAKQASDHDHKLRITICISGWLTEKEEAVKPWAVLGTGAEVFALKYELEALLNLGNAMNGLVQSAAWGYAQQQLIAQTIFADLAAAMWPIGLVKAARVIDNPFNVAKSRSEKAGEVLADALINKAQGERPVTLIGYSLGARVIYTCLKSLAKRKAFGLVENAVLFGAPTPSDTSDWRMLRSVVTGRLVNVYSENDYVLGFMYRTSSLQYGVAGLQAVQGLSGVENVNVSEEVTGHLRYRFLIGSILKKIGFEDINMEAVEEEKKALQKMEEEEKKNSLNSQRKRLMRRQSGGNEEDEAAEADVEASEIEKNVQEKTQKSLVTRAIEYFYVPNIPSVKDADKVTANVQKAAQNPSQVGEVAADSAKDARSATQTLAQRAYQALPSMPHLSRTSQGGSKAPAGAEKVSTTTSKATDNAKASADSYTARAAEYLPSLPKTLPSMPSLGRSKPAPKSKPVKVAETTASASKEGVEKAAQTTEELVRPTLTNVVNIQDNPAVSAATEKAKKAPIIHQAVKPAEASGLGEKAGQAASAVQSSASDAVDTVVEKSIGGKPNEPRKSIGTSAAEYGQSISDKTSDARKSVVSPAKEPSSEDAIKSQGKKPQRGEDTRTYAGYAASYLPSMPRWSKTKQETNRERKGSQGTKPKPPKLERRGTSSMKLERKQSGGIKSPPPKLGSRSNSGVNSNQPKLNRQQSGMKSPLTR